LYITLTPVIVSRPIEKERPYARQGFTNNDVKRGEMILCDWRMNWRGRATNEKRQREERRGKRADGAVL
jgi:hypothetical protein